MCISHIRRHAHARRTLSIHAYAHTHPVDIRTRLTYAPGRHTHIRTRSTARAPLRPCASQELPPRLLHLARKTQGRKPGGLGVLGLKQRVSSRALAALAFPLMGRQHVIEEADEETLVESPRSSPRSSPRGSPRGSPRSRASGGERRESGGSPHDSPRGSPRGSPQANMAGLLDGTVQMQMVVPPPSGGRGRSTGGGGGGGSGGGSSSDGGTRTFVARFP